MRAGLRPALHLFLAERARRRDGRAAGRESDGDHHTGEVREAGAGERAGAEADVGGDRAPARPRSRRRFTAARGCGTTALSTRATRAKSCRFALLLRRKATRGSCARTRSAPRGCRILRAQRALFGHGRACSHRRQDTLATPSQPSSRKLVTASLLPRNGLLMIAADIVLRFGRRAAWSWMEDKDHGLWMSTAAVYGE